MDSRKPLKKWQMYEKGEKVMTHTGLEPSEGKWHVPTDETQAFMAALDSIPLKSFWCIGEVLPADAVSSLVFDIDLKLSEETAELTRTIMCFAATMRDVLKEHSTVYDADRAVPSDMYILCKPHATKSDEVWKHGFKVVMPLDITGGPGG